MGRGSYRAADWFKLKKSRNITQANNEKEIFKSTKCDPKFDPKFIRVREARDSEDHPESTPIIIGLDVTGSMGYLAEKVAKESLNETMMKLYSTNVVKDPAIMFAAYGDYNDMAPLQVTQFESDIRIAEQLLNLWLEDHGSGMVVPNFLWYFAANNTETDSFRKRHKKGFIFTIGDDAECRMTMNYISEAGRRVFGESFSWDTKKILEDATEKYEIFHLFLNQNGKKAKSIVELLPGHTMLIAPSEIDSIPEILISTMQMVNGMSLDDAVNQWPELKRAVVSKALSSLRIENEKGLSF